MNDLELKNAKENRFKNKTERLSNTSCGVLCEWNSLIHFSAFENVSSVAAVSSLYDRLEKVGPTFSR